MHLFSFSFNIYSFIWLCWIAVVPCGISSWGTRASNCGTLAQMPCSTRGQTQVPRMGRWILNLWATRKPLGICFLALWKLVVQDQGSEGPVSLVASPFRWYTVSSRCVPMVFSLCAGVPGISLCVLTPSSKDTPQTALGQPNGILLTSHFHALEKETAAHSSVLAWRIPGTEEPGGLPSLGLHRVRHD